MFQSSSQQTHKYCNEVIHRVTIHIFDTKETDMSFDKASKKSLISVNILEKILRWKCKKLKKYSQTLRTPSLPQHVGAMTVAYSCSQYLVIPQQITCYITIAWYVLNHSGFSPDPRYADMLFVAHRSSKNHTEVYNIFCRFGKNT